MALVLSRKRYEEVVITTKAGEQIVVGVAELRSDKVRLAFDANPNIKIHRREVHEAINQTPKPKAA